MRTSASAVIAIAGLAFALGGCGAADSGSGGAGTTPGTGTASGASASEPADDESGGSGEEASNLDACALVSAADVAAVLGEPADAGLDYSSGPFRACSWTGLTTPTEVVNVSIGVYPDAAEAREAYLSTTEGLGDAEVVPLGDEASYTDGFGLRVLSGTYDISVDNTGDDRKGSSISLAQQIMAKLP